MYPKIITIIYTNNSKPLMQHQCFKQSFNHTNPNGKVLNYKR